MTPWDQRLARVCVRPLARTGLTPNQLTAFTLALAVLGSALLATGDPRLADWGAGVFVLSRFLDHFDGELARLTGATSRLGYYLDYAVGALSYASLFVGMALGVFQQGFGLWSLGLGAAGAVAAMLAMRVNLDIDAARGTEDAIGYPAFAGFELEDGIYLLAPVTWLGLLPGFLALAGFGACVYLGWSFASRLRLAARRAAAPARADDQAHHHGR